MTPTYWPEDHFRCEPEISPSVMIHFHCRSDLEACIAFRASQMILRRCREEPGGSLLGAATNVRNVCITGPCGRLLRDVTYSDAEIERAVRALL